MLRQSGLGALLLSMVVLTACSSGQRPTSQPTSSVTGVEGCPLAADRAATIVKSADTSRFEPSALTGRAGVPITVALDNSGGAAMHDFTIDSIDGTTVKIGASPGTCAIARTFAPPAGQYEFYCSQPGRKEAGMVGTLTVS
jgi:uncharacterized cupredoxin-like copper-binding protein